MSSDWLKHAAATALLLVVFTATAPATGEFRAVYVATADFANTSADTVRTKIDGIVTKAAFYNFNAIVLQVRVRGDAYYLPNRNSTTYPNPEPIGVVHDNPPGFDALQYAIDKGHEQDLRVIAWLVCYPTWERTMAPAPPNHVYNAHHDWVTQDVTGNYAQTIAGQSAALDPGIPAAQDYLANIYLDVVRNYDVDGIHFDYFHLPENGRTSDWSKFGYNTQSLAQFTADMGLVYTPATDTTKVVKVYQQWQREQVDTLARRVWEGAKREKPWVDVSSFIVNIADTPRILAESYNMWTNRGHMDYVCGGSYIDTLGGNVNLSYVESAWNQQSNYVLVPGTSTFSRPIVFAAGADAASYGTTTDSLRAVVNTMRAKTPPPAGFVHSDYGGLSANSDLLFHSLADTGFPYDSVAPYPSPATLNALGPADTTPPNPPASPGWSQPFPGEARITFSRPATAADGDYPVEYRIYRDTATTPTEYYDNLMMVFWDHPSTRLSFAWDDVQALPTAYYKIIAYDRWHNKASAIIGPVTVTPPTGVIIIETRSGGQNYTLYSDSGMQNNMAKSTAPGCTPGIGSRYSTSISTTAYGTFAPNVTGAYDLYITVPGGGNVIDARNSAYLILPEGTTGTIPMTDQDPEMTDAWYRFAANVQLSASSQIRIGEQSPQAKQFSLDAVRLVPTTGHQYAAWESKPLLLNLIPNFGIGDAVIADDGAGFTGTAGALNLLSYCDKGFATVSLGLNYGPDNYARNASGTTKANKVVWSVDLPVAGKYDVKAWVTDFTFTTTAKYQFRAYADSTFGVLQTITVDASQANRGGGWCVDVDGQAVDTDSYWFKAGKSYVVAWDESASAENLRADAVRWKLIESASPGADVSLTKADGPDPVLLGNDLVYTLTVINNGPGPATGVSVVDTLPDGVSVKLYTSPRGTWSQQGNNLVCDIGTMENGEVLTLTIIVQPFDSLDLLNVATVSTTSLDPNSANDSSSAQTTVTPRVITRQDDTFTTDITNPSPGGTTGWTPFSSVQLGQWTDYDAANTALKVTIATATVPRVNGWSTANSEWLPYSTVGTSRYVRGKFHVFRTGQDDMSDLNQIPNMRLRLSTRFAQNSMLEVFNHLAGDVTGTNAGQELRPSSSPAAPSIYRVDFDPVDVPVLNTAGEGISRGFEAYSLESQENGAIELSESVIGTYPASALPDTGPPVLAARVLQVTASDAGDLKIFNTATDGPFLRKFTLVSPGILGSEVALDGVTDPAYDESSVGVAFDTTSVASDRVGFVIREFTELGDNSGRIRVEPGRQYKIRWHVISGTNSNRNPQMRLRTRALKFCWAQKLEVGGALAAGTLNNSIAQQALPGSGCANPDQLIPGEPGGWYTMLFHTPMSTDIQASQPFISGQPGPGSTSNSMRDIKFGFDLIDTLSGTLQSREEKGSLLLDRIELRAYEVLPD